LSLRCRLCVVAQSSFSISDPFQTSTCDCARTEGRTSTASKSMYQRISIRASRAATALLRLRIFFQLPAFADGIGNGIWRGFTRKAA
jgi:hypothetical protein